MSSGCDGSGFIRNGIRVFLSRETVVQVQWIRRKELGVPNCLTATRPNGGAGSRERGTIPAPPVARELEDLKGKYSNSPSDICKNIRSLVAH